MTSRAPLDNVGVLVTRPVEQAEGLMSRLRELGARPLLFPALAIFPPDDLGAAMSSLARLDAYRWVIFVSPTAVDRAMVLIPGRDTGLLTCLSGRAATVGAGTAAALRRYGVEAKVVPESGADSEHLLAMPEFTVLKGDRILIVRGEEGRAQLAETIQARGGLVDHAVCYRRGCPVDAASAPMLAALESGGIQAVTVYSAETLDNLLALLGSTGARYLRAMPVFAVHPRVAEHARARGMSNVPDLAPGEVAMLAGLVDYFRYD